MGLEAAEPRLAEAAARLERPEVELRELAQHLTRIGPLTHLTGDMYISSSALEELSERLVAYLEEHGEHLAPANRPAEDRALLPLLLGTGFLDGLNPCAFAVLLFFIAFLFTIRRTTGSIWIMGLIYVAAIYLAYFLIGLGLMQAVLFTNDHHLMAKIGSWLVIGLGFINLKDYFFPQLPIHLRIPTIAHGTIQDWLKQATFPAAGVGGFLVGLCTFPCSGGIYVAIVTGLVLQLLGYYSYLALPLSLPISQSFQDLD